MTDASPTHSDDHIRVDETSLRRDAERNRERIMTAARKLYSTHGLGVTMAAIAREAGVGKATLARRFEDRQALIQAVFLDRMEGYAAATEQALAALDPWEGFVGYIETICAMQAKDHGFASVLTMTFDHAAILETRRAQAYDGFIVVIDRARSTGYLRSDFGSADLVLLLMANAGVISATAAYTEDGWRRLVGHMLRAFSAEGAPLPLMPAPPDHAPLYAAMAQLGRTSAGLSR